MVSSVGPGLMVITGKEISDWSPALKEQMVGWLKANGLEPADIHVSTESPGKRLGPHAVAAPTVDIGICVGDGEITYREFIRAENGAARMSRCGDQVLTVERTVPMVAPIPPAYAALLAGARPD